jgi:hypothetical protein
VKRVIAVVAVAVAGLVIVGVASAQIKTTIDHRDTDSSDARDAVLLGVLDSPKAKCESGRAMKLLVHHTPGKGGGFELADTDRSSHAGGWALRANLLDVDTARIRVAEKKLGHGNGTCAATQLRIGFA